MADITLNDLLGKPKQESAINTNFLASLNDTLKQIQEIIGRINELKNNPAIQSYIYQRGRRLEEMGLLPRGLLDAKAPNDAFGNSLDGNENENTVKKKDEDEANVNGEKVFNAICGALNTVKTLKGDITISELQEYLQQNKEMVIKVLNEHKSELR